MKTGEQVRKILISLLTAWQPKVITLECQDIDKMSYDEFRGNPIDCEKTHLNRYVLEEKKKNVAFEVTTAESKNEEELEGGEQDKNIAMLSRVVSNMMRKIIGGRKGKQFPREGRPKNENDERCHECGKFGHIQPECPELKRKINKDFQKKKSFGA